MKIGYDEKTDDFFITEMTRMEAGVIAASVSQTLKEFNKVGKEVLQECCKMADISDTDIKEMITAHQAIIKGLIIAKKMQMDSAI